MTPTNFLRIVAAVFILFGLSAIWTMIGNLFSGVLTVSTSLLSLFIGIGLLRHRPLWRTIAMAVLVLTLAFVTVICVLAIVDVAIPVRWFGTQVFGADRRFPAVGGTALLLLMHGGMLWVLAKAEVKALFDARPAIH